MTVGWPDAGSIGLHRIELGGSIMPSAEQMNDVCAFYDRLARRVAEGRRGTARMTPSHGLALLAA